MARIVLESQDYHTLHLMALAFGGIGWGRDFGSNGQPYCVHGMAHVSGDPDMGWRLYAAGLSRAVNDDALKKCRRKVSWKRYCELAGVTCR